jgi:hypothetical protein
MLDAECRDDNRSDYVVITTSFRRLRHVVYSITLTSLAPNALIDRLY